MDLLSDQKSAADEQGQKLLYLIDGSSYIFRAYFAMVRNPLTTSEGTPVGAVFGFTQMLLRVIREAAPPYLGVAFDPPGPSFRKELRPEYKANREAPPEDMRPQFPLVRELVRRFDIPVLEVPGFEADDVLGTLALRAAAQGYDVVLITGDKDFNQLVSDQIRIWDTMKNKLIGPDEVRERYAGVGPEGVVDIMCLSGDSSDNVEGVPGVGEKTASKLIAQYGSLEGIYDNIEKVKGPKTRERLAGAKDQAFSNRELIRIRDDVEVPLDFDHLRYSEIDPDKVRPFFDQLEFRSLSRELAPRETVSRDGYRGITDAGELDALVAQMRAAKRFAFDLETTGLDPLEAQIVGFAIAVEPGEGVYIPVAHHYLGAPKQLDVDTVLEALGPLLADPEMEIIGQNLKYDLSVLRARHEMELGRIGFDTMLAAYVLDPGRRSYKMDLLAHEFLGHRCIAYEDVAGKGKTQKRFDEIEVDVARDYAAEDADVTLRLGNLLQEQIKADDSLQKLLDELETPLVKILAGIELAGVRIDVDMLGEMSKEMGAQLEQTEERCHKLAGRPFNVQSPTQLRSILFEEMELPVIKRTKSGPSTDQEVLEKLAGQGHELPAAILEHRHVAKLKSTYVDALPKMVSPVDGRVHSSFNQTVAATGRLSSADPNLQNIPIRTEMGRRIRKAFVAEDGHLLVSADYSQIELRILAHISEDPGLVEAFTSGADVHAFTASRVFGVPLEEVDGDMRRRAKAINFGVVYGQSAFRLGQSLDIPTKEAARFIEDYFERYAGVKGYMDSVIAEARETKAVRTLLGRRRFVNEIDAKNGSLRQAAERIAINTPIQGSAADLIKLAMLAVDEWLRREGLGARMILQVHDELVLEVPESELDAVRQGVVQCMAGVMELSVPLKVDVGVARSWDEAH